MARMRWSQDVNWDELESEAYNPDEFEDYDGPLPPHNMILAGVVRKMWATTSSAGDEMIKVLFVAAGNEGEREVYNGAPLWDNISFTLPQVKFRWQPWLDALGVTLADLKSKTIVGDEEDRGDVIEKIGRVNFAGKTPVAARVKVVREKYNDEAQAKVGKWLPPAMDADDADADEADDWDDEDDEPPARPARKRRAAAAKPARKARRPRRAEPEPDDEEDEYDPDDDDFVDNED